MTDTLNTPEPGILKKAVNAVHDTQLGALKKIEADESADLAIQSRKAYENGNFKESLALSLKAEGAYLKHALHSLHDSQLKGVKAVGGAKAADLAEQGYQAYTDGHLMDGFKLGVKSEIEAAKHLLEKAKNVFATGEDVGAPAGAPATPAKPITQDKGSLKP